MKSFQAIFDKSAIGLSILCIAHCLLVPVLITLLPVVAAIGLGDESFHRLLIVGILPISVVALFLGCRRHRTWSVLLLGTLGLIILVVTAILGHEILGDFLEKFATVIGSVFIMLSHFRNFRLCRQHQYC